MLPAVATPDQLRVAIDDEDVDLASRVFARLTGWSLLDTALDEDAPVLYAAVSQQGSVRGVCAYVRDNEVVVVPEQDGPMFLGCPGHVIDKLDVTFAESAVRWRRDCLARFYRDMSCKSHVGHPAWTAFYSQTPLGVIKAAAHIAIIVGSAPRGEQSLAITDGSGWKQIAVPVESLASLEPLWPLEWSTNGYTTLAMRGRGTLKYVGVGPAEYRVGMLFNELGGLLAWSGAATHCALMAGLVDGSESGFTRPMLLAQLNGWQGRSATV